ncbi:hemolysin XhlA family protein [Alkalihalobacillus trypoxylicola]|nr:hemolysin XhlA family protein [Alkalihalobacillus trypoxylicola]
MAQTQKELLKLENNFKVIEKDVRDLQREIIRHDEQISVINKMLDSIADDTKWIKRTISTAIIGAICTGVLGGAIALFYANL